VEFNKATSSGVNILLRYVAALYVAPKNIAQHVFFKNAVAGERDGKKGIVVTVENDGTKHALLSNPVLKVQTAKGAAPVAISGDSLSEIDGQNLLAKSSRTFFVPWDASVEGASYEGSFDAEIE
jgi:P pilus assembly chaperone PapD